MDLEFALEAEETNETHRNPFGNMNYELADAARFDQKGASASKVYGEKGDHVFWPTL